MHTKNPDAKIIERKIAFNKSFQEEVSKSSKFLKGTPSSGKSVKPKLPEK